GRLQTSNENAGTPFRANSKQASYRTKNLFWACFSKNRPKTGPSQKLLLVHYSLIIVHFSTFAAITHTTTLCLTSAITTTWKSCGNWNTACTWALMTAIFCCPPNTCPP